MNLQHGSMSCTIVKECRNIAEGIAQGDFGKVALNTGILSLAALPGSGGPTKLSSNAKVSVSSFIKASTFSTAAAAATEETIYESNMTGIPDYYTPKFFEGGNSGDMMGTRA